MSMLKRFVLIALSFLFLQSSLPAEDQHPLDLMFTDQTGSQRTRESFTGKIWIANFIFTRCQGICLLSTGRMAQLQEKLPQDNIKLISFSVDPEYDTPEVLSQYAAKHHPKPGKWLFLTAEKKELMWRFIIFGFQLGVAEPTEEELKQGAEPIMHSAKFVLVDQQGEIQGYFDSDDPASMDRLAQAAQKLAG